MAQVVEIQRVRALNDSSSQHAIRKMKRTLEKQGQIEPLQVRLIRGFGMPDSYTIFHDDPWGNEILWAARELGWKTILIVEMQRYEP
jgi:hypothetical protein